jgi:hypothetical protein
MVYYAFDLLHLDGFDTRAAPLVERKRVLQSFLAEAAAVSPLILYSEHFENGMDLFGRATAMGLEGIVSKRSDAPYRSGRGEQWIILSRPPRVSMSERHAPASAEPWTARRSGPGKQHEVAAAFASCAGGWNIVHRERCEECSGRRRRDLGTQYFFDHIFLYRCGQNLPYKFSDP